jgi:hypothetical protein
VGILMSLYHCGNADGPLFEDELTIRRMTKIVNP